jgi:hypothetical protein
MIGQIREELNITIIIKMMTVIIITTTYKDQFYCTVRTPDFKSELVLPPLAWYAVSFGTFGVWYRPSISFSKPTFSHSFQSQFF